MKSLICLIFLILTSSIFACEKEAQAFLQEKSPAGSTIKLESKGNGFDYFVRHKSDKGTYSESGSLEAKANCQIKVTKSQIQSQGDIAHTSKSKQKMAQSDIELEKLSGEWLSGCIQSQDGEHQGYVIESYRFSGEKDLEVKKTWFKDANCKGKSFHSKNEKGSFEIGMPNTNNGFNPAGTYEAKYSLSKGVELGLIWISDDFSHLRLSRGFGSSQNTMLSLTRYNKR